MKHSYLLAGISLRRLVQMLARNHVGRIPFRYLGRLLFLLQSTPWTFLFRMFEQLKYHQRIKAVQLPPDPVIIIGHWRTGSTYLHQLLSLDPQFTTARVFQVATPDIFLSAKKYFKPVMQKFLGSKRPMDNVTLAVDEPQEDEYALLKMASGSPLEKLLFQKNDTFFLEPFNALVEGEKQRKNFKQSLSTFYKKILLDEPAANLVIKNPFHTLRLDALLELFPKARFVHIYRNPFHVIPSTRHMWQVVGHQNTFTTPAPIADTGALARVLKGFLDEVEACKIQHPSAKIFEMAFETLEAEPITTIHQLYNFFEISFSDEYQYALQQYTKAISGYRKNDYPIDQMALSTIKQYLNDFNLKHNYQ